MSAWFRQLRGELFRLFARKRTYIGFGAFLALEAALIFFFQLEKPRRWIERMAENAGGSGAVDEYFSALTLGFLVLRLSVFLLGGLYLALVAGDIVAKEAEDGTLRMVLSRPVSRLRLLAIKWAACVVYSVALVLFIGATSLGVGLVLRGWGGGFMVIAPEDRILLLYPWGEGLAKYAVGVVLLALSMTTVSAIGFFFSCLRIKPAAATILTLTVLFADFVLEKMPPLEDYRPYFLTAKMGVWVKGLLEHPPWAAMAQDYIYLAGVAATFLVAGWLIFQSRDFKT